MKYFLMGKFLGPRALPGLVANDFARLVTTAALAGTGCAFLMAFLTLLLVLIAPPSRTGDSVEPSAGPPDQEESREKPMEQAGGTTLVSAGRAVEGLYTVKKGGAAA
jgi:Na+-transporting methylmalonyl-CoA/oxaloacetate decarboxylase gamma subunit